MFNEKGVFYANIQQLGKKLTQNAFLRRNIHLPVNAQNVNKFFAKCIFVYWKSGIVLNAATTYDQFPCITVQNKDLNNKHCHIYHSWKWFTVTKVSAGLAVSCKPRVCSIFQMKTSHIHETWNGEFIINYFFSPEIRLERDTQAALSFWWEGPKRLINKNINKPKHDDFHWK